MKRFALLGIVTLVLAAALVYALRRPEKVDETARVRQTVTDFYTALIPADPRGAPTGFRPEDSNLVSEKLKADIAKANRASEMGIGFDPFLCAQAFPSRWSIGEVSVVDDTAQVVLESFFGESANPVVLTLQKNDIWQINATSCFPGAP